MADLNNTRTISELRDNRGWLIALGIALILLGAIAFAHLFAASIATVYYLGMLMFIGGVAQLVMAFRVKTWGRSIFLVVAAILYGLAGVFAFVNPLLASTVMTLLLAVSLIASGVFRIIVAVQERQREGWGWILAMGILTIVVALMVLAGWPVNSLWILGLFLATDLIAQGFGWLFVGLGLSRL